MFDHRAVQTLNVQADHRVIVCTRGGPDTPKALQTILEHASEALGGPINLAPSAAPIRANLEALSPNQALIQDDWPPTVTTSPRTYAACSRTTLPLLGYYRSTKSRPWPEDREDLQDVLPDHPLLGLSVYGADEDTAALLRQGAGQIRFENSDTSIGDFLAELDALSTNADPADDPWPEEMLNALTHGTIPVLHTDFRPMFVAAALYVQPKFLADTVIELFSSPDLIADMRVAASELIHQLLAPRHLLKRIAALIGPPAPLAAPISQAKLRPEGTVISVSTNGIGMGHLARQMAIARRLPAHLTPVFLGFSQSVAVVRQFGWMSEYLPYHSGPALHTGYWNEWLVNALDAACRFYKPRALVLDANVPFIAFAGLRELRPGLPMIWVRRAMWGPGRDLVALERAPLFDTVLEPGERAAAYDTGPTTLAKDQVRHVAPMQFLDASDLLSREQACAELGIAPDTTNVLLMPGGLNNFDATSLWFRIASELGQWSNTTTVTAEWAITERSVNWPANVVLRKGFPYARWFNAFDFAVSAVGYNSFAELTGLGLPAIFVPNENPLMDRQDLRAIFAARNRLGLHLAADALNDIKPQLEVMRDPANRAAFRDRLAAILQSDTLNGAIVAADIVAAWADAGRSNRPDGWQ